MHASACLEERALVACTVVACALVTVQACGMYFMMCMFMDVPWVIHVTSHG